MNTRPFTLSKVARWPESATLCRNRLTVKLTKPSIVIRNIAGSRPPHAQAGASRNNATAETPPASARLAVGVKRRFTRAAMAGMNQFPTAINDPMKPKAHSGMPIMR